MKRSNWFFSVIVVAFSLFTFTSCSQYDDFDEDFIENPDNGNNDDNSDDNGNSGNNGGGNTGGNASAQLDPDYGIAIYQIDGSNIILAEEDNKGASWMRDRVKHEDIWEIVRTMIPFDARRWMTSFEIFDGDQQLLGYVYNTDQSLSSWVFALDISSAYLDGQTLERGGDFIHTIIHEYGHIMSLNDSQLNPGGGACNNYNPGEGCANESSYIDEFYERFWEDIAGEHADTNGDDDAVFEFYQKYSDRFVSDYSATNPAEDIAEVFAHFVTTDTQPNGSQIKDEKVRFMYEYPELVNLRNHMRNTDFTLPPPGSWSRPKCRKHNHNHNM